MNKTYIEVVISAHELLRLLPYQQELYCAAKLAEAGIPFSGINDPLLLTQGGQLTMTDDSGSYTRTYRYTADSDATHK